MWRIMLEGMSIGETAVLVDVDGFRAALCGNWIDLTHGETRRHWRTSLFDAKRFERGPNGSLIVNGTTQLPDVSSAFVDGLAARLSLLVPGAPAIAVAVDELEANSTKYNLLIVRTRGHHIAEFEGSRFAGAWLSVPQELGLSRKELGGDVEIEGLFLCDPLTHAAWRGPRGYGHMGMSPAELIAYRYSKR